MKYCANCKLHFTENVSFCTQCGGSFNVKYCYRRLHLNPVNAKYCKFCGTSDMSKPNPPSSLASRGLQSLFIAAILVAITALFLVLVHLYSMDALPPRIIVLAMVIAAVVLAAARR